MRIIAGPTDHSAPPSALDGAPDGMGPEVAMARQCRCCGVEVREHLDWCPLCGTRLVLPWRTRLLPWAVIALEVLAILAIVSKRR
jgi:hypothetical protein